MYKVGKLCYQETLDFYCHFKRPYHKNANFLECQAHEWFELLAYVPCMVFGFCGTGCVPQDLCTQGVLVTCVAVTKELTSTT